MPDIAVRPVLWTAAAFVLVVAAVVAAVLGLLHWRGMPAGGERLHFGYDAQVAAPGLASAPQEDLARYRREKQAQLESTGWVDRQAGVAHIPIADAMDLLVQRGG